MLGSAADAHALTFSLATFNYFHSFANLEEFRRFDDGLISARLLDFFFFFFGRARVRVRECLMLLKTAKSSSV